MWHSPPVSSVFPHPANSREVGQTAGAASRLIKAVLYGSLGGGRALSNLCAANAREADPVFRGVRFQSKSDCSFCEATRNRCVLSRIGAGWGRVASHGAGIPAPNPVSQVWAKGRGHALYSLAAKRLR